MMMPLLMKLLILSDRVALLVAQRLAQRVVSDDAIRIMLMTMKHHYTVGNKHIFGKIFGKLKRLKLLLFNSVSNVTDNQEQQDNDKKSSPTTASFSYTSIPTIS